MATFILNLMNPYLTTRVLKTYWNPTTSHEVSNVWVDSKRRNKFSAVIPDGPGAAPRRADRTFLANISSSNWMRSSGCKRIRFGGTTFSWPRRALVWIHQLGQCCKNAGAISAPWRPQQTIHPETPIVLRTVPSSRHWSAPACGTC